MFMQIIVKAVSLMLSVVMTITAPLGMIAGKKEARIARAKDDCRVSFAAISDIHMRGNFGLIFRGMLELGLYDMERAEDKLDAVAFVGDVTDHGDYDQWDAFAASVSGYDIAGNKLLAAGNHDTWGPYSGDDYDNPTDGVKPTFIRYSKEITGRNVTEMYYSDVINGCYFIVLGSEEDHTWSYLSDTQLAWFAGEMEKAGQTGLPIFVFNHQPLNGTHGLPYLWELDENDPPEKGGIGDQSDAVEAILKQYDNVFYISGHIHSGFKNADSKTGPKYASVEYLENDNGNAVTLINLPTYLYMDLKRGGHIANGCGWVVEAYDDEVLLRARNFATGTWLTKYDKTVALVG